MPLIVSIGLPGPFRYVKILGGPGRPRWQRWWYWWSGLAALELAIRISYAVVYVLCFLAVIIKRLITG